MDVDSVVTNVVLAYLKGQGADLSFAVPFRGVHFLCRPISEPFLISCAWSRNYTPTCENVTSHGKASKQTCKYDERMNFVESVSKPIRCYACDM